MLCHTTFDYFIYILVRSDYTFKYRRVLSCQNPCSPLPQVVGGGCTVPWDQFLHALTNEVSVFIMLSQLWVTKTLITCVAVVHMFVDLRQYFKVIFFYVYLDFCIIIKSFITNMTCVNLFTFNYFIWNRLSKLQLLTLTSVASLLSDFDCGIGCLVFTCFPRDTSVLPI